MTRPLSSRSVAVWTVGLLLVGVLLSTLAEAGTSPDPADTMTRLARDLGLQTKMPADNPPPPDYSWSDAHWHIPAGVAQFVLYGALALGLAFVLFALRGSLPILSQRRRLKAKARDVAVVLPNEEAIERMSEAGDEADELARRGLFAEAMHMLLLRSVAEMRSRLDVTIADSLTSREILARLSLPDLGRRALAELIQRVEFVHFGKRAAAREDYGACRAAFEALIGAMRAPAAA